jgi:hypothetical protein
MTTEDIWPEGHAEFVAYCDAHPEATRDLTPFGWFQAGLLAGRTEARFAQHVLNTELNKLFEPSMDGVDQPARNLGEQV